jgi:hypothetical protein
MLSAIGQGLKSGGNILIAELASTIQFLTGGLTKTLKVSETFRVLLRLTCGGGSGVP